MDEKKSFQIVMDPSSHAALKIHAKTAGLTIGQTIENLVSAFELRIRHAYADADFHKAFICRDTNRIVADAILRSDEENWTDEKFKSHVRSKLADFEIDESKVFFWKPKIQYSKKVDKK